MLNNAAAPSYFNGGSLNDHKDYRFYVISRLRYLKMLDDKEVSDQERSQALLIFGKLVTKANKSIKKKTKSQELSSKGTIKKVDGDEDCDDKKILNEVLPNITPKNDSTTILPIEIDVLPNIDQEDSSYSSSQSSVSSNESLKITKKKRHSPDYLHELPNLEKN